MLSSSWNPEVADASASCATFELDPSLPQSYCCVVGIILKTGEAIVEKISFRAMLMLRAGAVLGIVDGGPERKGASSCFGKYAS